MACGSEVIISEGIRSQGAVERLGVPRQLDSFGLLRMIEIASEVLRAGNYSADLRLTPLGIEYISTIV